MLAWGRLCWGVGKEVTFEVQVRRGVSSSRVRFAQARPGAVTEWQSVACEPSIHTSRAQQGLDAAFWALFWARSWLPTCQTVDLLLGRRDAGRASPLGTPKEDQESLEGMGHK